MPTVIKPGDAKNGDIINGTIYGGQLPNFNNCTVVGRIEGAALRDSSAAAINHANIWPSIPPELDITNDFRSYEYFLLKTVDDVILEIGIPWIDVNSVTRSDRKRMNITIVDFDESRQAELRELLNIRGFGRSFTTQLT